MNPFSAVRREGNLVFVSGQVAPAAGGDICEQTTEVLRLIEELLSTFDAGLQDIVDVTAFVKDPRWCTDVLEVARPFFPHDPPAWTLAGLTGSAWSPDALVMIRAVAYLGDEPKRCITPHAQTWRDDYPMSAAVVKGPLVFVGGQLATKLDGTVEPPFDHVAQARECYAGMLECLKQAGADFADVLDFTSFHEDIRGALPTMDDVYIPEVMAGVDTELSATTSHLGSTGLMVRGALGTFHALADLSGGGRVGCTPDSIWWKGVLPIAGAARKRQGRVVTVAGQVACNPDASIHAPGDPDQQAVYIFECMREALAGVGATMADIVEINSYHKDPRSLPGVLSVAREYLGENSPAWTAAAVPGLWMEGYLHEIAATAIVPDDLPA
ncbi:Rid family hydrolase [Kibdelosporangium aridum]|uniref:Enamine deaminase RidA, house cleaning of reactive enamine intermediates, YjgF/YER057c/UK114 family n=1 Tax=Kibdelosporangium aridum TaxID=2030 RepID=A0A1W2FX84_KIBAR|nr:Rid family hydrolase [Kibdelosporangium aridum]SMD26577.1 Enamine deaminase RidA, house cleaning of reactive enamine intermediates, YjgF/YER057c/UK114 family [Kibdelosporangium aridum]